MAVEPSSSELPFTPPVSGVFALDKPSGPTCMSLLERLKPLFASSVLFSSPGAPVKHGHGGKQQRWQRKKFGKSALPNATVKIGQGGTLDPLASGIMVVGLNEGTKKLGAYQSNCDKGYEAVGMLGCETDSYDSKGKRVALREWRGIEEADVEAACAEVAQLETQIPPIYSALKMDGHPLYHYARQNLPLPRPVEARPCKIHSLSLTSWTAGGSHPHRWPTEKLSEEDRAAATKVEEMVKRSVSKPSAGPVKIAPDEDGPSLPPASVGEKSKEGPSSSVGEKRKAVAIGDGAPTSKKAKVERSEDELEADDGGAPVFGIRMDVSSGTYVRTVVHDVGKALGSAATVVGLTRTKQGDFSLADCIDWSVFESAAAAREKGEAVERDGQGLALWERTLIEHLR